MVKRMLHRSTTEDCKKDEWRTPPFVFDWASQYYPFDIDLCATSKNALCKKYFTKEQDCLAQSWHERGIFGFCNPPYSNIGPFLEKAIDERDHGFHTAFLIPTPNGERYFHDHIFGQASKIIFITGRISFLTPGGKEQSGNPRGSCFVLYEPNFCNTQIEWIDREVMKKRVGAIQKINSKRRFMYVLTE